MCLKVLNFMKVQVCFIDNPHRSEVVVVRYENSSKKSKKKKKTSFELELEELISMSLEQQNEEFLQFFFQIFLFFVFFRSDCSKYSHHFQSLKFSNPIYSNQHFLFSFFAMISLIQIHSKWTSSSSKKKPFLR